MTRMRKLLAHAMPALAAFCFCLTIPAAHAEAFRPEIANPLQAAANFAKNKKFSEAMAKVREAEAVGGKTAAESAAIEQMKSYVASTSGDVSTAVKSYESQIESGRLGGAEKLRAIQAVASLYMQAKDYSKASVWAQRYIKEGGTDPQMRNLPIQLSYLTNDCGSVIKQLQPVLRADSPAQDQLELLANCASKQKDDATYIAALEKLVANYPTKDYWRDLLNRVERKPGFKSGQLSIDIYRLKMLTGNIVTPNDYIEYAQTLLQDKQNNEAKKVVDRGFAMGVLGTGADVNRHNRLKALVEKRVAEDTANAAKTEADAKADADSGDLLRLGHNYITAGQTEKGLALFEEGISKELKRPDNQRLKAGVVYLQAGQRPKAMNYLKSVTTKEGGFADIARLWMVVKPTVLSDALAPVKDAGKGGRDSGKGGRDGGKGGKEGGKEGGKGDGGKGSKGNR